MTSLRRVIAIGCLAVISARPLFAAESSPELSREKFMAVVGTKAAHALFEAIDRRTKLATIDPHFRTRDQANSLKKAYGATMQGDKVVGVDGKAILATPGADATLPAKLTLQSAEGHSLWIAGLILESADFAEKEAALFGAAPFVPKPLSSYQQGLRKLPEKDTSDLHFSGNAADLAKTQSGYRDALSFFEKAVVENPADHLSWFQLGRCRYRVAYGTYRNGAILETQVHDAFEAGVRTALAAYEKSVAVKPDFARGHLGVASAHFSLSDDAKNLAALLEAVRLDPAFVEAHSGLAMAYGEAGIEDAYQKELAIIRKLDPGEAKVVEKRREMMKMIEDATKKPREAP